MIEYHHKKQKGIAELKKAVKQFKDSYIVVDTATNSIIRIVPSRQFNGYDDRMQMIYRTDWRKENEGSTD